MTKKNNNNNNEHIDLHKSKSRITQIDVQLHESAWGTSIRCCHNQYGVSCSILKISQSVVISRATTHILITTVSFTIVIVDPVPSGISGWSP